MSSFLTRSKYLSCSIDPPIQVKIFKEIYCTVRSVFLSLDFCQETQKLIKTVKVDLHNKLHQRHFSELHWVYISHLCTQTLYEDK